MPITPPSVGAQRAPKTKFLLDWVWVCGDCFYRSSRERANRNLPMRQEGFELFVLFPRARKVPPVALAKFAPCVGQKVLSGAARNVARSMLFGCCPAMSTAMNRMDWRVFPSEALDVEICHNPHQPTID